MLFRTLSTVLFLADLNSGTSTTGNSTKILERSISDAATPGSWTAVAPIAVQPRQEHGAVKFDDDTFYIIGGIFPEVNGIFPWPTVSTVQKYTISTNTCTSVADLPVPLNHPNSAVVNGKIYVLGGLTTGSDDTNYCIVTAK